MKKKLFAGVFVCVHAGEGHCLRMVADPRLGYTGVVVAVVVTAHIPRLRSLIRRCDGHPSSDAPKSLGPRSHTGPTDHRTAKTDLVRVMPQCPVLAAGSSFPHLQV